MSKSRNSALYLDDINEAIQSIGQYLENMSFDDFLTDKKTRDAVARNLEIIGEAAGKLDPETREKMPDIDWSAMIGMRNSSVINIFEQTGR